MGLDGTNLTDHVVIIGWNDLSKVVADKMLQNERKVAFLIENKDNFELAEDHYEDRNVFLGFTDTVNEDSFRQVNLHDADKVLVNRSGDAENLITILAIKEFEPSSRTIVCAYNEELIKTFKRAGASYVLSRQDVLAQIISNYITAPDENIFTEDFIQEAEKDGVLQISEN